MINGKLCGGHAEKRWGSITNKPELFLIALEIKGPKYIHCNPFFFSLTAHLAVNAGSYMRPE
jgi:hypothetical protein